MGASRDSSRDHPYGHYGGGGGGGYHGGSGYRGGRGRGGRGRGRFGRGRGRGRGGRGRGPPRNSEYEDPNARLVRQLSVMVSRLGDLKSLNTSSISGDDNEESESSNMRPVVVAEAKNISDLTQVVCKSTNMATFLKFVPPPPPPQEQPTDGSTPSFPSFTRPPPKPEDAAGPMAHLIVSCSSTLPLQTPCYAALTLSVNEYSKSSPEYKGFAKRCVTYAMQRLAFDMDTLFLSSASSTSRPKVACRIKLLMRYLAMLGKLKIVQGQDNEEEAVSEEGSYSLLGLLQRFVEAAVAGYPNDHDDAFSPTSSADAAAPLMLVYFVLSTIPYLLSFIPTDVIEEKLLDPLQPLMAAYSSTFTPGTGMTAILLKEEQVEGEEEDDDEEDDDDDEEEEDASGQVCDSLQDLYRSVKMMMKDEEQQQQLSPTRFALLSDAPWKSISAPPAENTNMDTSTSTEQQQSPSPTGPIVYTDSALRLEVPQGAMKALNIMMNPNSSNTEALDDDGTAKDAPNLQAFQLEVVVFGRLPFFGAPQTGDNADGDEEDMEEDEGPANEQVAAYMKEFGILDRCFLADTIRDLLLCHESAISAIGQEKGSVKSVAEQIWSVSKVFHQAQQAEGGSSSAPKGMEYGIIEALLGLIVQSSSSSTFRQIFLSRVLLELTRLQPTLLSPALAIAVSNLFQDYMPSLVPAARHNLSCWFAFHLINTDYQWPAAYWTHWQSYFGSQTKPSSRQLFVHNTLMYMMLNVNNPGVLIKECLPLECHGLLSQMISLETQDGSDNPSASVIESIEKDIQRRIWEEDEHPDSLRGFVGGDELSETLSSVSLDDTSNLKRVWCRSGIVLRVLLQPLEREHRRLQGLVEQAQKKSEENGVETEGDDMEEDEDMSEDVLAGLQEVLSRYGVVLAAAIAKDKEMLKGQGLEDSRLVSSCEPYLLQILEKETRFSRTLLDGCLVWLVQQPDLIEGMAILRWALGDFGGQEQSQPPKVVERWWEFAIDALRVEVAKKIKENDKSQSSNDGGMVIDRIGDDGAGTDEQPSSGNLVEMIECLNPLLDYLVRTTCSLLTQQIDHQHGNKLKPWQVDLVEGVKFCLRASYELLYSELPKVVVEGTQKSVLDCEIKESIRQSTLAGSRLAGICQEFSGGHAINVLHQCLMKA